MVRPSRLHEGRHPQLSHLLHHEDDGPRLLHGFRFEHLSTGRALPTIADLDMLGGGLAAVLLELPLRDAGCLLPEWHDLRRSRRGRASWAPVHLDGARIWESQPYYDRPLAEIAGLADSVYVSFYKGLGGLAGACLLPSRTSWPRRGCGASGWGAGCSI